jgi:hypothetical protein
LDTVMSSAEHSLDLIEQQQQEMATVLDQLESSLSLNGDPNMSSMMASNGQYANVQREHLYVHVFVTFNLLLLSRNMMLNLDGQLRMTGTDLNDLLRQVDELNSESTSSQGTRYVLSTLQNHMRTLEAIKGTTGM